MNQNIGKKSFRNKLQGWITVNKSLKMNAIKRGIFVLLLFTMGIWLLGAASYAWWVQYVVHEVEAAANHDFLPEAQELAGHDKLAQAQHILEFATSKTELPHQKEMRDLLAEVRTRQHSPKQWVKEAAEGVLTGKSDTLIGIGALTISDFFVFGDIRDLAISGYQKATGQQVDQITTTLAGLGLATTLIPEIDILPSFLKSCGKLKTLSKGLCKRMFSLLKESASKPAARKELGELCKTIKGTSDCLGVPRTMLIMRVVEEADELTELSITASYCVTVSKFRLVCIQNARMS